MRIAAIAARENPTLPPIDELIDMARSSLDLATDLFEYTRIPDTEIDNLFRAAFARDKNTQVVLKADKGVQHGRVVNLMERAKQAGLTRLAIGTSGG